MCTILTIIEPQSTDITDIQSYVLVLIQLNTAKWIREMIIMETALSAAMIESHVCKLFIGA